MLATNSYEMVFEGDITACFDEISHSALLNRVRRRIGDRRILALVKSSSKPGSSVRTRWKGTRSPAPPKVALGLLQRNSELRVRRRSALCQGREARSQGPPL
jgi:RNA-directed DNA polymerase